MYSLSVLDAKGAKSMRQQDQVPAECLRGIFPCLSQLLVVAVHPWQPLACSYITAISASVVMWPSSLCVSVLSHYKATNLNWIKDLLNSHMASSQLTTSAKTLCTHKVT